jgi:RNA polymerase-binding transcription factor DksA
MDTPRDLAERDVSDDTQRDDTQPDTVQPDDTQPDAVQDEPSAATPPLDLAAIEADLADVEVALARLDAGTYWTCEVTGQPLSEELMAAEPTRRRSPAG